MLASGIVKKKMKLDKGPKPTKVGKIHPKIKNAPTTIPPAKKKPVIKEAEKTQNKKKQNPVLPSKSVNENLVTLCLNAVQKLNEHYKKNNRMFEDETAIFAEIHCLKIQNTKGNVSFVLPHGSIQTTGEVCLITPDLKKGKKIDHEPTVDHWEELLRKAGVKNVKTVLPMRQLRVEYDQYELKRRLLTQHDFIMVDTRVLNHVSHCLGKMFFKKHNMLVPVRIKDNDKLKQSIDIGLRTAMLRLNIGETSTIRVGHTGMPQKQVKENVLALIKQLQEKFPGGEANIRSISLKLPLSLSVPLYVTLRSSNTVKPPKMIQKRPKHYKVVEDELSTIPGSIVSVAPDGSVHLKRKAAGSEDDSDADEDFDEDEDPSEEEKSD